MKHVFILYINVLTDNTQNVLFVVNVDGPPTTTIKHDFTMLSHHLIVVFFVILLECDKSAVYYHRAFC